MTKTLIINYRSARKRSVKKWYVKRARTLSSLSIGESVYFENKEQKQWKLGKIKERLNERSYIVESQDEGTYRRNRVHIRPAYIKLCIRETSPLREPENTDIPTNIHKDQTTTTPSESNNSGMSPSENVKDDVLPNSDTTTTTVPSGRPKRNIRESAHLKDFVYYKLSIHF
ncbi:hypothetical protein ACJMK2_021248 [Sinanodonta woodiana]|uniref:DUF5641 domain-containing protein n=1 Tax=Sinanodonta woodiana TaxID=1069815 RepID=A0ABD3TFH9_SINWO